MIEDLLNWLTIAMSDTFGIALLASLCWGIISIVLSPCHLSSIPLVIGYITSQGNPGLKRSVSLSLLFAAGILVMVGIIGAVTVSLGRMMGDVGIWGSIIVAAVFFIAGFYLMDIISISWGGIMPRSTPLRGWRGAMYLGLLFGVGLGPCTFAFMAPVLGAVFSIGSTDVPRAVSLIAAFGIGHCSVIVGAGSAVSTVQKYLNWTGQSKGARYLKRTAGALVFCAGIYYCYTAF